MKFDSDQSEYMLFAHREYYPSGGWEDFKGFYYDVDHAMDHLPDVVKKINTEYGQAGHWHIVNPDSGYICRAGRFDETGNIFDLSNWPGQDGDPAEPGRERRSTDYNKK